MENTKLSLIVAFAQLWGATQADNRGNEELFYGMMAYDSNELSNLLSEWAEEYLNEDYEDTAEFFEEKIEKLFSEEKGDTI